MKNPFQPQYQDQEDLDLIEKSLQGDKAALDALVKRHQTYLYNIAWRFCGNADDAWDITQEVLVKVITKLSQFSGKSTFRTWLYRIALNDFLQMKRSNREQRVPNGFDDFGPILENIPDQELTHEEQLEQQEHIEEMKLLCMSGMLLCLSRDQRLVFILGELLNADHNLGAEVLNISAGNFRVRLARARKDLYNFMNRQCGLVNKNNPCRCRKKTTFAIEKGFIKPGQLQFNLKEAPSLTEAVAPVAKAFDNYLQEKHETLMTQMKFKDTFSVDHAIKQMLEDQSMKDILR